MSVSVSVFIIYTYINYLVASRVQKIIFFQPFPLSNFFIYYVYLLRLLTYEWLHNSRGSERERIKRKRFQPSKGEPRRRTQKHSVTSPPPPSWMPGDNRWSGSIEADLRLGRYLKHLDLDDDDGHWIANGGQQKQLCRSYLKFHCAPATAKCRGTPRGANKNLHNWRGHVTHTHTHSQYMYIYHIKSWQRRVETGVKSIIVSNGTWLGGGMGFVTRIKTNNYTIKKI